MELPAAFEKRMQDMLGAEYTRFGRLTTNRTNAAFV